MKKEYMQPTLRTVKVQHSHMLCSSPYNDVKSIRTYDDEEDVISDKDEIW